MRWLANLSAVFPTESAAALKRRALDTYRSYAFEDDFICADCRHRTLTPARCSTCAPRADRSSRAFCAKSEGRFSSQDISGNWEVGGLLMGRVLNLPLTIVAMPEADPAINGLRRETRERMGIATLEVRQSLETPLAIRRTLAGQIALSRFSSIATSSAIALKCRSSDAGRGSAHPAAVRLFRSQVYHSLFSGALHTLIYDDRTPANRRRPHPSRAPRRFSKQRSRWRTRSRRASGSNRISGITSILLGCSGCSL